MNNKLTTYLGFLLFVLNNFNELGVTLFYLATVRELILYFYFNLSNNFSNHTKYETFAVIYCLNKMKFFKEQNIRNFIE